MTEQATTPDLTAHVAHLIRHDSEFPQSGVCLGRSDYLIERIRETWHRIVVRKDDGQTAEVSYMLNGDRTTGRYRTADSTSPDLSIDDLPHALAQVLDPRPRPTSL